MADLLARLAEPGQPQAMFAAIEEATRREVGHKLFTLLIVDGADVARVHSSRPREYPEAGRKPMGPTAWGKLVIQEKKVFFGPDEAAIRWAFYDHDLIVQMGLGSCLGVPVVYNDTCLGSMNLLDAEYHYQQKHVAPVQAMAPLLIPAFLQARQALSRGR